MWTRAELKQRAKNVLRRNYLYTLIVCIVLAVIGGGGVSDNFSKYIKNINSSNRDFDSDYGIEFDYDTGTIYEDFGNSGRVVARVVSNPIVNFVSKLLTINIVIIGIIFIIFRIFAGYSFQVGAMKYLVSDADNKNPSLSDLGFVFKEGSFGNVTVTMFLTDLFLTLWTFLLIVPGIIKSFEYYFIPYILADNPNMNYKRAFELSKLMTNGEKMNIFVLRLSFVLWMIASSFVPFGYILLAPYIETTDAQLYLVFRERAINSGYVTYEELNLGYEILPAN